MWATGAIPTSTRPTASRRRATGPTDIHRTESHDMQVYIPNNAPRGSTFEIAFFRADGVGARRPGGDPLGSWAATAGTSMRRAAGGAGADGHGDGGPGAGRAGAAVCGVGADAQQRAHRVPGQHPRRQPVHLQLRGGGEPSPGRRQLDALDVGGERGPRAGNPVGAVDGSDAEQHLQLSGVRAGADVGRRADLLGSGDGRGDDVPDPLGERPRPSHQLPRRAGVLQPGQGRVEQARPRGPGARVPVHGARPPLDRFGLDAVGLGRGTGRQARAARR